jgi:hypothetical protein
MRACHASRHAGAAQQHAALAGPAAGLNLAQHDDAAAAAAAAGGAEEAWAAAAAPSSPSEDDALLSLLLGTLLEPPAATEMEISALDSAIHTSPHPFPPAAAHQLAPHDPLSLATAHQQLAPHDLFPKAAHQPLAHHDLLPLAAAHPQLAHQQDWMEQLELLPMAATAALPPPMGYNGSRGPTPGLPLLDDLVMAALGQGQGYLPAGLLGGGRSPDGGAALALAGGPAAAGHAAAPSAQPAAAAAGPSQDDELHPDAIAAINNAVGLSITKLLPSIVQAAVRAAVHNAVQAVIASGAIGEPAASGARLPSGLRSSWAQAGKRTRHGH